MNCEPRCDMLGDCKRVVTHIGEKGYIYCAEHANMRTYLESTRKLRTWELNLIRSGRQVPSYRPISREEARNRGVQI